MPLKRPEGKVGVNRLYETRGRKIMRDSDSVALLGLRLKMEIYLPLPAKGRVTRHELNVEA